MSDFIWKDFKDTSVLQIDKSKQYIILTELDRKCLMYYEYGQIKRNLLGMKPDMIEAKYFCETHYKEQGDKNGKTDIRE